MWQWLIGKDLACLSLAAPWHCSLLLCLLLACLLAFPTYLGSALSRGPKKFFLLTNESNTKTKGPPTPHQSLPMQTKGSR